LAGNDQLNGGKEGIVSQQLGMLRAIVADTSKRTLAPAARRKPPRWDNDTEAQAFLREAVELIEGKAVEKKP
jgi:hypothetical protein